MELGGLDVEDALVTIRCGTACLFGLRVIRPSLPALRSTRFLGYGERFLAAQGDPALAQYWRRVQNTPAHPLHLARTKSYSFPLVAPRHQ